MPTPKKHSDLHWLTGTKSQAQPESESTCEPGRPKYPRGLSVEEKVAFKRLVKLLESRRAATEGDVELIRLYAITYARHMRALAKLAEQGEVVEYTRLNNHGEEVKTEKPNYYLKIAESCEKNSVAILDRLGLTPLNREKVKPTGVKATQQFPEGSFGWLLEQKKKGLLDDVNDVGGSGAQA